MFTDSYHPTVDGAVVAMERQCDGLEARGHEIVLLAPDNPGKTEGRWPVHYLPSTEFRSYKDYRIVVSPSDMLEYLRREEVDLVHCHGLASMAILSLTAARALRIPSVLTFHTMASEAVKYYSFIGLREDLLVPLVWVYLRNLMRRPDMVVFPSAPIADEVLSHGVKPRAHEVIPTGVDCGVFSPANRDPSAWTNPDEFDIDRDRHQALNLSFGYGIHSCLGAALARMESCIALEKLLDFMPRYEVDWENCNRVHMHQPTLVLLLAGIVAAMNALASAFVATVFRDRERSQFTYSLLILISVSGSYLLNISPATMMTHLATGDTYTGVGAVAAYGVVLLALAGLFMFTSHKLVRHGAGS